MCWVLIVVNSIRSCNRRYRKKSLKPGSIVEKRKTSSTTRERPRNGEHVSLLEIVGNPFQGWVAVSAAPT